MVEDRNKHMANPPTILAGLTMALPCEWHACHSRDKTKEFVQTLCGDVVLSTSTLEVVTLVIDSTVCY